MNDESNPEEIAGAPTDSSLLLLIERRDESAMAQLFSRHSRLVYSIALRVLRDVEQAEDVLQDVFMQLWKKPVSFDRERGSLSSLLAVMTRNRAVDALRRRKPTQSTDDFDLPSSFDLSNDSERRLLMDRVRKIVDGFPEAQQTAFKLAFFEGLTHGEIADKTGTPLGTVKTRIRSVVQSLGRSLTA